MKTKMLRWIAPAVLSLALVACSDDDAPSDPAGTVTLNMLDAENGKTYLGSTGFYINEADNFYSNGPFRIADVGPVRGIGSLGGPATSGLTDEAAVMPGHGYMIFADDALLSSLRGRRLQSSGPSIARSTSTRGSPRTREPS